MKLLAVAVKTKGTTDDEGQTREVRECGENENDMSADPIGWFGTEKSEIWKSSTYTNTEFRHIYQTHRSRLLFRVYL